MILCLQVANARTVLVWKWKFVKKWTLYYSKTVIIFCNYTILKFQTDLYRQTVQTQITPCLKKHSDQVLHQSSQCEHRSGFTIKSHCSNFTIITAIFWFNFFFSVDHASVFSASRSVPTSQQEFTRHFWQEQKKSRRGRERPLLWNDGNDGERSWTWGSWWTCEKSTAAHIYFRYWVSWHFHRIDSGL